MENKYIIGVDPLDGKTGFAYCIYGVSDGVIYGCGEEKWASEYQVDRIKEFEGFVHKMKQQYKDVKIVKD